MLRSTDRIRVSHAGALEQPESLRPSIKARDEGQPYDETAFVGQLREAVGDVVAQQLACGLDSVNEGEFGKQNFTSYVGARIAGYEPKVIDATKAPSSTVHRDINDFTAYYAKRGDTLYGRGTSSVRTRLTCVGPLKYVGHEAIQAEIANLGHALEGKSYEEAFLPAAGPGILTTSTLNEYYGSHQEFLMALADAMHDEYQAIVDAGYLLQVDDPHLLMAWQQHPEMSRGELLKYVGLCVDAINHALRGISPEKVRLHTCWGSWLGPHTGDIPLGEVASELLRVNAAGLSIEASNPRHEHEWQVWNEVKLPADKVLMPGVAGHYTDFVEHPELIAARLERYAGAVGRERVVAGTDCGLRRVGHPDIAWAKFRAMVEGARIATEHLWP